MTPPRLTKPMIIVWAGVFLLVTLACGGNPQQINTNAEGTPISLADTTPRWACPTPPPLPSIRVEDGSKPNAQGTPETQYRDTEPYEREYGRPVVRPTTYSRDGERFFIGQIVNLANGVDLQIEPTMTEKRSAVTPATPASATPASATSATATPATAPLRLTLLKVTLHNGGEAFFFDPARQVVISAVKLPNGRILGGTWTWTIEAATLAGLPTHDSAILHQQIGRGETVITLPILLPEGTIEAADVRLDPPGATAQSTGSFRIQFSPGHDPKCAKAGTVGADYGESAKAIQPPLAVPPGTDALVATALGQVGRQYCWGGKGFTPCSGNPETPPCASYPCFDCSGLMQWTYKQQGINILAGTVNQKNYPEVPLDQIQPGDLVLFGGINQNGRGAGITHVGMYAGDLDGDGKGDLIHAANYPDGIIITKNVFGNPWYKIRVALITRPPR